MTRLRDLIDRTHKHGVALAKEIEEKLRLKRALEKLNAERRKELGAERPKPKVVPPRPAERTTVPSKHNIAMYDSIIVSTVPPKPEAVAGYTGGHWANFREMVKTFPNAHHLSIAVFAREDAQCLDIEKGDASPSQAPVWVKRQHARGINRPALYMSLSTVPAVLGALSAAGIPRRAVRLWTAHYTYKPHLCNSACGYEFKGIADGTQWTDRALGRNLDESLTKPDFFS